MTISNIRRVERIGSSPSAWLYTGEGDPTVGDGLQGDEGSLLVTTFDEIVYRKTGPDPVDWSPFTALPGPPSGDAGGVLDGTYPNPTFADSPEFSGGLTVLDGTTDVQALTAHGLIQALASLTVAAAMTLTLTGANVAGAPSWGSTQSLNTSGNAGTATALQTARAIYGNNFDGTAPLTSVIVTTYGGTGLASWTGGDVPYYVSGTALSKLGIGAANRVLTSSGSVPQWSASLTGIDTTGNAATATALATPRAIYGNNFDGTAALTSAIVTTYGGTGISSWTGGDLPYYISGTALSKLGIGAANRVLTSTGSVPQWVASLTGIDTTGNAATATALQNARTIGGVSFDGTGNITVSTATGGFTVSGGTLTTAGIAPAADATSSIGDGTHRYLSIYASQYFVGPTFNASDTAHGKIIGGSTDFSLRNTANSADNILITDAGNVTFRSGSTFTLTGVTVVGFTATTAATLSTPRTLWGQSFDGSANVTGAMSGVTTIALSDTITTTKSGLLFTRAASGTAAQYALVANGSGEIVWGVSGSTSGGDFFSSGGAAYETVLAYQPGKQLTIGAYTQGGVVSVSSSGLTVFSDVSGSTSNGSGVARGFNWLNTGAGQVQLHMQRSGGTASDWYMYLQEASASLFWYSGADRLELTSGGDFKPGADNSQSIGSGPKRWLNIFASQYFVGPVLNASDYTHGDFISGSSDIRLRNNANNATNVTIADAGTVTIGRGGLNVYGSLTYNGSSGTDWSIINGSAGGLIYMADENGHTFQTYSGGWQTRVQILDNGDLTMTSGNINLSTGAKLYFNGAGGDIYAYRKATKQFYISVGGTDGLVNLAGDADGAGNPAGFMSTLTTSSAANLHSTGSSFFARSTSARINKRNIETLSLAKARSIVLGGRAVTFRSAIPTDDPHIVHLGFIGEEMQQLWAGLVQGEGRNMSLAYDRITAPLVAVAQGHEYELNMVQFRIQQMAERFQEHQSWLQQIELWKDDTDGRLDQLEDRVSRLEQAA